MGSLTAPNVTLKVILACIVEIIATYTGKRTHSRGLPRVSRGDPRVSGLPMTAQGAFIDKCNPVVTELAGY